MYSVRRFTGEAAFSLRIALLFSALAILAACSGPAELAKEPQQQSPPSAQHPTPAAPTPVEVVPKPPEQAKNLAVIRVFYATDRSRTSLVAPARAFGAERGELSFGTCEVGVPRDPAMLRLEPAAAWKLEYSKGPGSHPTLRKVAPREQANFLDLLRGAIGKAPKRSALVFVHGFDISFAEAARRTAQLKYDLAFDGAAIFFSWPSKGKTDAYSADEAEVEWAQPDLKEFLKNVAGKTGAKHIYLIGHGMGNRALAKALIYLASERPELTRAFREVILVAPDIDSDLFYQEIAPALGESRVRTTLYASSKDPALRVAVQFQGNARAGHSGEKLVVLDGIETIDASNVSTALTGHSSVLENRSVVADIYRLIRQGKGAAERSGIRSVKAASGRYWKFKGR